MNNGVLSNSESQSIQADMGTKIGYGKRSAIVSIIVISMLFAIKVSLGYQSGSISIIANAFHLLSHLANAVILLVSFHVMSRPATEETPFGYGRMEYVAPLIMAIFLFVTGFELLESSVHQTIDPHELHYTPLLPVILLLIVVVKEALGRYVRNLAHKVDSEAIHTTAYHHRIDASMTVAVILGLIAGEQFHLPVLDGIIGIIVSIWLLHLGYDHAREAITPLLGKAPDPKLIEGIRRTAREVEGVEDVHEIIVQDYGTKYIISMHVEIPEALPPAEMHAISERCEGKLREKYDGEIICHTDPLLKMTPENKARKEEFRKIIDSYEKIESFHDFRVIAESKDTIIIAADIDIPKDISIEDHQAIKKELEQLVIEKIDDVAYCTFYITPMYSY